MEAAQWGTKKTTLSAHSSVTGECQPHGHNSRGPARLVLGCLSTPHGSQNASTALRVVLWGANDQPKVLSR